MAACRHCHTRSCCLLRILQQQGRFCPPLRSSDFFCLEAPAWLSLPSCSASLQPSFEHALLYGKFCKSCGWFLTHDYLEAVLNPLFWLAEWNLIAWPRNWKKRDRRERRVNGLTLQTCYDKGSMFHSAAVSTKRGFSLSVCFNPCGWISANWWPRRAKNFNLHQRGLHRSFFFPCKLTLKIQFHVV